MTNPLRTLGDYELFIYSLAEQFPSIRVSTLQFIRRGATFARVVGEIHFEHRIRLAVLQRLIFDRSPGVIDAYSYEVWRDEEKLYWYDPQPHPDQPSLQETFPHHKHTPPNIRHHRLPAPNLNFTRPNLPVIIREIEELIRDLESSRT